MKNIILGSHALYIQSESKSRKPLDFDVLTDDPINFNYDVITNEIVDISTLKTDSDKLLFDNIDFFCDKKVNYYGYEFYIPSLPTLSLIKFSHLFIPNNFTKHITDFIFIKKLIYNSNSIYHNIVFDNNKFTDLHLKFYKLRSKEHELKAKKHPKLNVSKNDFFNSTESYNYYDHDSIHRAIAVNSFPAYTLMQDGEVFCSKKKWDQLSYQEKILCAVEESAVLALERSIIPAKKTNKFLPESNIKIFIYALQKVCTTITSGWFRRFCIDNYYPIIANYYDFESKFNDGLKNNTVLPYKGGQ